ncbi:hypothetical protein ACFCYC_17770 [Streptomyces sp. NPDC056402]|uniref:hypothetical protein n=1 Tax=Streptomyces sp. NPDC056402 TaxID=3345810 RepID=UPI0035D991DD
MAADYHVEAVRLEAEEARVRHRLVDAPGGVLSVGVPTALDPPVSAVSWSVAPS